MLLIVLSFFALTTAQVVNAQNGEQIESIVEQIQEHNEREELKTLSLNELESVDKYLSSKLYITMADITMDENQILTLTQDLLSNGNSVNYVVQENLNTTERKEELRSEAQESAENLSEGELLNIAGKENITTYLLLGIGTALPAYLLLGIGTTLLGAILYALNKKNIDTSYYFAGVMLFTLGLGLIAISLFDLYIS